MNELEFTVITTRLIWGEVEADPTPQETVKRLKALLEERDLFLWALKDLSEALLTSTCWTEQDLWLNKALLWGLHTLQDQQELTFKQPAPSFELSSRPADEP